MLIDDVVIDVLAGDGGNGSVAFNKNMMELGPTGASGGNGGSVYCVGVADIGALSAWRNTKTAKADSGQEGGMQYRDGSDGTDIEFSVPVGTVVHNLDTGVDIEISAIGQRELLAILDEVPRVAVKLLRALAERVRDSETRTVAH